MADTNQNQNAQTGQQQLQVKVPDDVQKGVYSNAVSVNVNSNEVVLDFGYLLPNTPAPIIEVVSRINMNQRTAESFISVLSGAMEDFKKKQAAQQAGGQSSAPMGQPSVGPSPMGMGPAPMGQNPMGPMGPAPMGPSPMGNPAPYQSPVPPPYPTNA
ncbi:MAG: DUF3467 domain-containing protein [Candidatus Gracilibacteria bacterium]